MPGVWNLTVNFITQGTIFLQYIYISRVYLHTLRVVWSVDNASIEMYYQNEKYNSYTLPYLRNSKTVKKKSFQCFRERHYPLYVCYSRSGGYTLLVSDCNAKFLAWNYQNKLFAWANQTNKYRMGRITPETLTTTNGFW